MPTAPVDPDVVRFVHDVFLELNKKITTKLSRNPNIAEEYLDMTWIDHLSGYSSAIRLPSSWIVKIDVHYLGGMRHFYQWEVADIGVLLFIRRSGRVEHSKVALLQSKRLYPSVGTVEEQGRTDYEVGFARLADPEILARSLGLEAEFSFDGRCKYGALIAQSQQVKTITDYQNEAKIAVYYQFYNPWRLPFRQRIPLSSAAETTADPSLGVKIAPSQTIHGILSGHARGWRPRFSDIYATPDDELTRGWRLEHFIAELFLGCKEGTAFGSIGEERIQALFYRRSGPIAAAVSINAEAPEEVTG